MDRLPADLPERLRAAGLQVRVIPGWKLRGRPKSTGTFTPVGVLWHHTGGTSNSPGYVRWMTLTGRADLPAPLAQLSIGRKGTVYVCAAGRANHAGKAKPSGTVAGGDGNRLYVGVECMNTGSEGWAPAQRDAMVTTGAVLADVLGTSAQAQRAHRETSYSGKWDPGGLDMDRFRADIAAAIHTPPEEDDMPEPKDLWDHKITNPVDGQQRPAGEWEWRTFNSVRRIERLVARGPAADELAAKVAAKVGPSVSAKDIAAELIRQLDADE